MTGSAGGLLPQVVDAASALDLIGAINARLRTAGVEPGDGFRNAPPEPTGCCGRGCNGCVWEGYYAALQWWREDALELLDARERSRPSGDFATSQEQAPASPSHG